MTQTQSPEQQETAAVSTLTEPADGPNAAACEPETTVRPLFTRKALAKLIVPLVFEQLLAVTVGMADTMMVSTSGQAAVSGISLVDQINVLLIQIFAALATGGAVVASQYLGRQERDNACTAAKQLLYASTGMAVAICILAIIGNRWILRLVFGSVDPLVMEAAETYFWLSALSYPFLAIYNAGAALYRSMGNSAVSLFASFLMNVINIGGNAVLIYGFGMGVAGAATASLVSRAAAAVVMLLLLRNPSNPIFLRDLHHISFHRDMVRSILRVGIPNGLENGMFQIGKLLVAGMVSTYGLAAITANAIGGNIGSLTNVPGTAIGLAMVTVVGQCMGAKDYRQARSYTFKLMGLSYLSMGVLNALLMALVVPIVGLYQVPAETGDLAIKILLFCCSCTIVFWPLSFTLPNALRAAGDARFTMTASMISMWTCRVGLSYVLGTVFGMGVFGVWVAMVADWIVRDLLFTVRFLRGRWQKKRVIDG